MCNAWNHSPGCDCGWGGIGNLGNLFGGVALSHERTVTPVDPFSHNEGALISYRHLGSEFCRSTTCPSCGASVYFIRHNGGSVWVDELGWPWPRHGCFDDSDSSAGYCFIADLVVRYADAVLKPKLGRVIKRIYRNFDHVYLIDMHERRLSALSASRYEKNVFTDLVAIRYTEDKIFLENNIYNQVRVRNFKLTEEDIQKYLNTNGEILYIERDYPDLQARDMVLCDRCKAPVKIKNLQRHMRKIHGS